MPETILKQPDGYKLKVYDYQAPYDEISGNILFFTDIRDHHERYEEFFHMLNSYGFDVYTYDYRGQGKDYLISDLGHIISNGGDSLLISDLTSITKYIANNNSDIPFFIMGVGFGASFARIAISIDDIIFDGVTLISPYELSPTVITKYLSDINLSRFFKDPTSPSKKYTDKIFENKDFNSFGNRTSCDWISRINSQVGQYIHDPLCGYPCSLSFYQDFLSIVKLASKKIPSKSKPNAAILVVSGSNDPYSDMSNNIDKILSHYKNAGFSDVQKIIYEESRHDLFHEKDTELFFNDIIHWLIPDMEYTYDDYDDYDDYDIHDDSSSITVTDNISDNDDETIEIN